MTNILELGIAAFLQMASIWQLASFAVYAIGLISIILFLWDNLKSLIFILKSILEPYFQPQQQQTLSERFGKWAVVTGSTDGIGREYAKELAKDGINIVLISRSENKLIETAKEIENQYKVKTKWIVADFSKGRPIYEHIKRELSGITVGILVNNVGKMYEYPEALEKVPEEDLWDIMNINIGACTMMSHMIIPQMKAARKGAIVNISSGSALQPVPFAAVYSASKRYMQAFSQSIESELADYNVTVQCVTPLFLITKMNHFSNWVMRGNILVPNVEAFTRSAVFTLGKTNMTTGYWTHGIQYFFMNMVPEWIRIRIGHIAANRMRDDYLQRKGKLA